MAPPRQRCPSPSRPGGESRSQAGVLRDGLQRRSEPATISWFRHERFTSVLGETRQVRRPPPDHRQTRRDRLRPRRPVCIDERAEREDVSRAIHPADLPEGKGSTNDDAPRQIGRRYPTTDALRVAWIHVGPSDQPERRCVLRQRGEGVQELDDALVRRPVRDTQDRHIASMTELEWCPVERHIASRWYRTDALVWDPRSTQDVDETLASGDEAARVRIREVVERSLQNSAHRSVNHTARCLMQDRDDRHGRPTDPRGREGRGEAVEQDTVGALPRGAPCPRRRHGREGPRTIGYRAEPDRCTVSGSGPSHLAVVAVATGLLVRVAG